MIYHVLPGDATAGDFRKTGIDGEVIVCRECLVAGPADADTYFEFWEQRAHFILAEYGEDEIEYHERVADELARLLDVAEGSEVNIWFEYELFCSVNMWFCLDLLRNAGAEIYRVEPSTRGARDRWKGFGGLDATDLKACFAARSKFSDEDLRLGPDLWNAFKKEDHARLLLLSETDSKCFPYLKEVCEAAVEKDSRPKEILKEIAKDKKGFGEIFVEFSEQAGVYGYGDLQVERLLEREN